MVCVSCTGSIMALLQQSDLVNPVDPSLALVKIKPMHKHTRARAL